MAEQPRKKDVEEEGESEAAEPRNVASTLADAAFKTRPQNLVDKILMNLVSLGFVYLGITLVIPDRVLTLLAIGIGLTMAGVVGAFIVPSA